MYSFTGPKNRHLMMQMFLLTVTLDGVVQFTNTEFVMHHSNNTIQFKDASIPSGTIVTILSMIGV